MHEYLNMIRLIQKNEVIGSNDYTFLLITLNNIDFTISFCIIAQIDERNLDFICYRIIFYAIAFLCNHVEIRIATVTGSMLREPFANHVLGFRS
jgi:hypothetical protein